MTKMPFLRKLEEGEDDDDSRACVVVLRDPLGC